MELYFPVLCRFAEKYVGDSLQAQDIVQETFIRFWKKRSLFATTYALKRFLYVSVRNACLDTLRNQQRAANRVEEFVRYRRWEDSVGVDEIIYSELLAAIRRAMLALPEKMQEVFCLAYMEGLSNDEISARLQLSHQTVRNQKTRALQILRRQFIDKDDPFLTLLIILLIGSSSG